MPALPDLLWQDKRLSRMARFLLRLNDRAASPLVEQPRAVQRRHFEYAQRILRVADATRRLPTQKDRDMTAARPVIAILWEWTEGKHKGARFWGCHSIENDGRVRDWPSMGLRPLGAARVTVIEGEGLELLQSAVAA